MSKIHPLKVVCGIILLDNKVLAARRDSVGNLPLLWEFPGGKLETDESAEEALHRELWEELQLKVEIINEIEPVLFSDPESSILLIPYLCKPAQMSAPIPLDHSEIRWITIEESQQLTWASADIPLVRDLENLIAIKT